MNNKKFAFVFLLLAAFFSGFSQLAKPSNSITLSGEFGSCTAKDSIRIWGFLGSTLQQLAVTPLQQNGDKSAFSVNINGLERGFYFVGFATNNMIPLILGSETPISLSGNCPTFSTSLSISGSLLNKSWNEVSQKINTLTQEANNYLQYFRSFPEDQVDISIKEKVKQADNDRMRILDSLKKADPFLAKLAALRIYRSYYNNRKPNETEEEYFGRAFFELADLKDPEYQRVHLVVESAQTYASTLTMLGLTSDEQIEYCDKVLEGIDKKSNTYIMLLTGFASGFFGKNDDSFNRYASMYLKDFAQINPMMTQQFQSQINNTQTLLNGAMAPDFKMMTPDGKEVSLSSLRGKVVMIDFWASWCKPCRKENPNVVRIYNRFKDKGFEILGVSFDQTKDAWTGAIAQDKLTWMHVSDLAGWGCAAGKLYKATSIPFTVIVGKDGKIIEKNLRGEKLEKKLEKILMQK